MNQHLLHREDVERVGVVGQLDDDLASMDDRQLRRVGLTSEVDRPRQRSVIVPRRVDPHGAADYAGWWRPGRVARWMSHRRGRLRVVGDRIWTAAEMELMSPDERARIVEAGFRDSLDDLSPEFRARVEAKSRRLVDELGLLDPEQP